jgi:hypothetical protein
MKTRSYLSVVAATLASLSLGIPGLAQPAATEPYLVRTSLQVRAYTERSYWKGSEKAYDHWTWLPEISAQVLGPLPSGTQVFADFTRPDGKPWMSLEMRAPGRALPNLPAGQTLYLENAAPTEAQQRIALTEGGHVGFQVRSLYNGAHKLLFKGRMKVVKAHSGVPGPAFKNQFVFYTDNDWLGNVGYLSQDTVSDPEAPRVEFYTWLKGPKQDNSVIKSYLYYQGKVVGNTASSEAGSSGYVMSMMPNVEMRDKDEQNTWRLWRFTFGQTYGYWARDANSSQRLPEGSHIMATNPGEYEFKLLRNGQLTRTGKFTIQANGYAKPSNFYEYQYQNGVDIAQQKFARILMLIPMTVLGNQDGPWNPKAWQTDAFWGNP